MYSARKIGEYYQYIAEMELVFILRDYILMNCFWVILLLALVIFIPRNKVKEAFFVFLLVQLITWPLGLAVVEFGWIAYPVRFYPYTLKSSFIFEYFVYPAICVLFVMRFPKNNHHLVKFSYYFIFASIVTFLESMIQKHTNIITYTGWTWYWSWLTLITIFFISRLSYKWYFNVKHPFIDSV